MDNIAAHCRRGVLETQATVNLTDGDSSNEHERLQVNHDYRLLGTVHVTSCVPSGPFTTPDDVESFSLPASCSDFTVTV